MSKNPASPPPKNGFQIPWISFLEQRHRKRQGFRAKASRASDIGRSASADNVLGKPEKLVKARQKPIAEPVPTRPSMQANLPSEVKGLPTLLDREPAPEFGVFSRQPLDIFQVSSFLAAYLIFR